MGVRQIRERPHVVPEAVLMRDPRDRHEACPIVDGAREIIGSHAAVVMFHDPHLDPARLLEMPVQHVRRVVVQLVDDDVVARLQIER